MKIFKVEFQGVWPVGNCLIIAAETKQQAEIIASNTIHHTDKFTVSEVDISEPKVVIYLSGNY